MPRTLIYVIAGCLLVGSGAWAGTPEQEVKQTMIDSMHAWDNLNPDEAAPYYAKDKNLVFYDMTPLKYKGWADYAKNIRKEFAAYKSYKTTLASDLEVHLVGPNFAWGIATWRADALKKDGSTEVVDGRWTVLLEKRAGKWLIVHEHLSSAPPNEPAGTAK